MWRYVCNACGLLFAAKVTLQSLDALSAEDYATGVLKHLPETEKQRPKHYFRFEVARQGKLSE